MWKPCHNILVTTLISADSTESMSLRRKHLLETCGNVGVCQANPPNRLRAIAAEAEKKTAQAAMPIDADHCRRRQSRGWARVASGFTGFPRYGSAPVMSPSAPLPPGGPKSLQQTNLRNETLKTIAVLYTKASLADC